MLLVDTSAAGTLGLPVDHSQERSAILTPLGSARSIQLVQVFEDMHRKMYIPKQVTNGTATMTSPPS